MCHKGMKSPKQAATASRLAGSCGQGSYMPASLLDSCRLRERQPPVGPRTFSEALQQLPSLVAEVTSVGTQDHAGLL